MASFISGASDADPRVSVAVGIVVGLLASVVQSFGRPSSEDNDNLVVRLVLLRSHHPEEEPYSEPSSPGRGEEGGL